MSNTHGGAFLDPAQAPGAIFTPEDFDAEQQALFDSARRFCDEQVWPRLADIEAVQIELGLGAPCGICHHNPCTFRDRADA